jgi:hypothetical protein
VPVLWGKQLGLTSVVLRPLVDRQARSPPTPDLAGEFVCNPAPALALPKRVEGGDHLVDIVLLDLGLDRAAPGVNLAVTVLRSNCGAPTSSSWPHGSIA